MKHLFLRYFQGDPFSWWPDILAAKINITYLLSVPVALLSCLMNSATFLIASGISFFF